MAEPVHSGAFLMLLGRVPLPNGAEVLKLVPIASPAKSSCLLFPSRIGRCPIQSVGQNEVAGTSHSFNELTPLPRPICYKVNNSD